jgi:hypothetical protein
MSHNDVDPEGAFAHLLAAHDEALAAGLPPPPEPAGPLPLGVWERLERARACLALLERLWPRPGRAPRVWRAAE